MKEDYIKEFIGGIKKNGIGSSFSIRGCSYSEVLRLEDDFGFCLPVIYK